MNLGQSADATPATRSRGVRPTVATRLLETRPLETAADEVLGYRWRDHHDIAAVRQLTRRYRWLVTELADSYRDSGLPTEDLTAEGSVGLMRAICRFDPDRGLGFATFGTWWVNAALQDYVRTRTAAGMGPAVPWRHSM